MEKFKHFIWDWNGTLFNDVAFSSVLLNRLLTEQGITQLSLEKYREVFHFPIIEYYKLAGLDFEIESFESIAVRWMKWYEDGKYKCELYEDAAETLQLLKNNGVQQYVLSAYSHHTLEEVLLHYDVRKYMNHVSGLDNIYAGSKVDLGKSMMKQMDANPADIVLIGDTTHDFEVAQALGINCILVARGHQAKSTLEKCGCEVVEDFSSLIN